MTARTIAPLALLSLVALAGLALAAQSQTQPQPRPDGSAQQENLVHVLMTTSKGDIVLELNREKAPVSVDNFLAYVDKKFYDGTIFHRVMSNFMIQGGGFASDMKQKPTDKPIKNEWQNGLKNSRGTIAMARLGDQRPNPSTVDSATSQFFINVVDNPALDRPQPDGGAYAVFGKVVAGMSTVDAIKAVPVHTHPTGHQNVPVQAVVIEKATRLTPDQAKERIDKEKGAGVR